MNQDEQIAVAARLLAGATHAIALVGAGMSRESGIPTFRGEGGLWTRFGEPPMNQYERFLRDPRAWWLDRLEERRNPPEFAAAIAAARPNPGHVALAELERMGMLRHTITQNVDNLQREVGQESLTEIHGNRTMLRCIECDRRSPWPESVTEENVPLLCAVCHGVLKSDTVMFGEPIPPAAMRTCEQQAALADVVMTIGTSATVYPAAEYPLRVLRRGGSLIDCNPEETPYTPYAAAVLRGPSGELLPQLVAAVRALRVGNGGS